MLYVLKHRALSVPILLSDEARAEINKALQSDEKGGAIFLGPYTLSRWGVDAIEPQADFLLGDAERLSRSDQARCKWGVVHHKGEHRCTESGCQKRARRDSPYILPETWAKADAEKPATPAAKARHVERATILRVTETAFRSGRPVLRTLVKFYRDDPTRVAADLRRVCATFDGVPVDAIPHRSLSDFQQSDAPSPP